MPQEIINSLITLAAGVFGWTMKTLWYAVKDLQQSDMELMEKVNRIEVLVAGEYVKKDELEKSIDRIFTKLDQIEMKIDRKADK